MSINFEDCPLIDYLDKFCSDAFNKEACQGLFEDLQPDSNEYAYSYGNLVHELLIGSLGMPGYEDVPDNIREDAFKRAFQAFYKTAENGYPEGMVMAGWCLTMGFGTEPNLTEARIWHLAAAKQLDSDHPQLVLLGRELDNHNVPNQFSKLNLH